MPTSCKVICNNFEGGKLALAVDFTRVMIFGIVFIGLSNIMTSWLQISGTLLFQYDCVSVQYINYWRIILSATGDVKIMAIGTLIGIASQFIFQLPFAIKKGYKYKLYLNPNDEYIKKMILLIMPVFIGVAVNQLIL